MPTMLLIAVTALTGAGDTASAGTPEWLGMPQMHDRTPSGFTIPSHGGRDQGPEESRLPSFFTDESDKGRYEDDADFGPFGRDDERNGRFSDMQYGPWDERGLGGDMKDRGNGREDCDMHMKKPQIGKLPPEYGMQDGPRFGEANNQPGMRAPRDRGEYGPSIGRDGSRAENDGILSAIEEEIYALTNDVRSGSHARPLRLDGRLSEIARSHSADMQQRNYFNHSDPDRCDPSCRLSREHVSAGRIAENIYMVSGSEIDAKAIAERVVDGWMRSSGHRENMTDDAYTEIGIGVTSDGSRTYVTALYARQ